MIKINFEKAKEITKDRLRVERFHLFELLDIETMKNIANTTILQEIEVEKQRLRDITKKVDSLITIEELKSITCKKEV